MNWNITHGRHNTPEYRAWGDMKQRCQRPSHASYKNYGGRGITVCDRWQTFENFFADMGERPTQQHSIDRRDNNGNYTPENCRWATRDEQMSNLRKTRLITFNGETLHMAEWARRTGIKSANILARIKLGWPLDMVLGPPTRPYKVILTTEQRTELLTSTESQHVLAARFGVSQMTISRIKRGVRGHRSTSR